MKTGINWQGNIEKAPLLGGLYKRLVSKEILRKRVPNSCDPLVVLTEVESAWNG